MCREENRGRRVRLTLYSIIDIVTEMEHLHKEDYYGKDRKF